MNKKDSARRDRADFAFRLLLWLAAKNGRAAVCYSNMTEFDCPRIKDLCVSFNKEPAISCRQQTIKVHYFSVQWSCLGDCCNVAKVAAHDDPLHSSAWGWVDKTSFRLYCRWTNEAMLFLHIQWRAGQPVRDESCRSDSRHLDRMQTPRLHHRPRRRVAFPPCQVCGAHLFGLILLTALAECGLATIFWGFIMKSYDMKGLDPRVVKWLGEMRSCMPPRILLWHHFRMVLTVHIFRFF